MCHEVYATGRLVASIWLDGGIDPIVTVSSSGMSSPDGLARPGPKVLNSLSKGRSAADLRVVTRGTLSTPSILRAAALLTIKGGTTFDAAPVQGDTQPYGFPIPW